MKLSILGLVVVVGLGVGGILGLRYQARQERVQQLAQNWSKGELAIGIMECRAPGELYMGAPCDEILEAYALRDVKDPK